MSRQPDDHPTSPRRPASALLRVAATAALVASLAGCGVTGARSPAAPPPVAASAAATPAPAAPAPTPSGAAPSGATPSGTGAPAVADIPVRSAALDAVEAGPAVAPPASLAIPSLSIALPVDPVGVEDDGQMQIPPLAERAGWYRFGAAPGAASGTAVVAAHVDSVASAGLGPFARLPEVQLGAVVEVTLADGTTRQYAVTDVARQAKPEIAWADVFVRDGEHRLVLVTCGGTFQREVGHYSDNVIVTAEPLGG